MAGDLVIYAVIALACGLVGGTLAWPSAGGFCIATAIGLSGALFGGTLARSVGAPDPFPGPIPLIWPIACAAAATLVAISLQRSARRRGAG